MLDEVYLRISECINHMFAQAYLDLARLLFLGLYTWSSPVPAQKSGLVSDSLC